MWYSYRTANIKNKSLSEDEKWVIAIDFCTRFATAVIARAV